MKKYDIIIIGSGPAGEKASVQASKLGKKVAVIEKNPYVGGAGLHTGTLPSKTLREAALYLAGFRQRAVLGFEHTLRRDLTLDEIMHRKSEVIRAQVEVVTDHFNRNNIDIIPGEASFIDANTLSVKDSDTASISLKGDIIVIATGTRPRRPPSIEFDHKHIHDSDTILNIKELPRTMTVIGGGVIGCEYACIFASLGVKVTLVEKYGRLLGFADDEIVASLTYWMRQQGITLRLNDMLTSISIDSPGRVITHLKSGKVVVSAKLLYTMGRVGNTDELNLDAVGLRADDKGLIHVNENYQTLEPHIYAIGDVVGFPSLASASMEQGRRVVCHAYDPEGSACAIPGAMPYGVYTIPEISMVGATEQELTKDSVPYEVGTALFCEVARGQISGDVYGMLKLIFHRESLKLLGVHIIGEKASELIHVGQAVMSYNGTIEYFRDVVFNYPTLCEAYKQAAFSGLNKL